MDPWQTRNDLNEHNQDSEGIWIQEGEQMQGKELANWSLRWNGSCPQISQLLQVEEEVEMFNVPERIKINSVGRNFRETKFAVI